jgi:hypothetical protein
MSEGETLQVAVLLYRYSLCPYAVCVLVVAQPSSEVPAGLVFNYHVYKNSGND